jgi:hypothetical protein
MARVHGIDPNTASPLMRLVFNQVRKAFGKDLTASDALSESTSILPAATPRKKTFAPAGTAYSTWAATGCSA